jgi:hypothetical protein
VRLALIMVGDQATAEDVTRQPGVAQVANHRCVAEQAAVYDDFGLQLPERKMCP